MTDQERIKGLEDALRWYVVNDDTWEDGEWAEKNSYWLHNKRIAEKLLGIAKS